MQSHKKSINYVNFFSLDEYNNNDLEINGGRTMSSSSHYCPILGKQVKVKGDYKETPKTTDRHTAMCQNNKKECDGNCGGCAAMIGN